MQKVNVFIHIWNDLRSNDLFGFNTKMAPCGLRIGGLPQGGSQRDKPIPTK